MPPQRRTLQGTTSPPPRILADSASSPCTSLVSASSSGPFLVGILDEARGRTLLPPGLTAELSFKMPTLRSLPQIDQKGQDGGRCTARKLHPRLGQRRPRHVDKKCCRFKRAYPSMTAPLVAYDLSVCML